MNAYLQNIEINIVMKSVLLEYAQPRTHRSVKEHLIYNYQTAMNYVIDKGKELLFIENGSHVLSLMTKTESYREQDDTANGLLQLMTKTRQECEHEDTNLDYIK